MGAQFRSAAVDGRIVLIPDDPAPGVLNPPLVALNAGYRADDAERRDEVRSTVETASSAMAAALAGRVHAKRATQKPLRPTMALPKAG